MGTRTILKPTPIDISTMVFVFGSNEAGIHGAGAARYALHEKGAVWGNGRGLQGQSYAIPTKGGTSRQLKTLPIERVKTYVDSFIKFANEYRGTNFQVTAIGCGLAGFKNEDIAPLFEKTIYNCYFDEAWRPFMSSDKKFWGTF